MEACIIFPIVIAKICSNSFFLEYVFTYNICWIQQGNYTFLGCSEKSNFKEKIPARVIQKKIKNSSKELVRDAFEILTNEKNFPKTLSQYRFLFTKLTKTIVN